MGLQQASSRLFQTLRATHHDHKQKKTGSDRKSGRENPEQLHQLLFAPPEADNYSGPAGNSVSVCNERSTPIADGLGYNQSTGEMELQR
jgi:hypothetical protein